MTDMMFISFALLSMTLALLILTAFILNDTLVRHRRPFRMMFMSCTMMLMVVYIKLLVFTAGLA